MVKKFEDNKNLNEMIKKYLMQILRSKSGKVIIGFGIWKSLPTPSNDLKNKLANRFERGLNNFAVKRIK
jgi:predicted butyrate kinase (DUF1464 family)